MKPVSQKFQVFVSSTFRDLGDERIAVLKTLEEMNCIASGMEKFPATDRNAWEQIEATIDASDYYVLLLGSTYGSIGPDGFSYTEMEYRYALKKKKPIIGFIQRGSTKSDDSDPKLDAFKRLVKKKVVKYWETVPELQTAVSTSLHQLIIDFPALGWRKSEIQAVDLPKPENKNPTPGRPNDYLKSIIGDDEWVVGAVNLDEDLHFSTLYLRQSTKLFLPKSLSGFGYSSLIGIFNDFNEKYFLKKAECEQIARTLVERILEDPDWFQTEVLDEIHQRVERLANVFPDSRNPRPFANSTKKELLTLYKKHNQAHSNLYEVARIPETLDRGVGYFTNYLQGYIRKHMASDSSPKEVIEVYNTLTFPEKLSKKTQEIEELYVLTQEIKSKHGDYFFAGSSKRMLLYLEPEMLGKIENHKDKWAVWGYHGYGSRATYDLEHYLKQISVAGKTGKIEGIDPREHAMVLQTAEERRVDLFADLGVDESHQLLFRFFSRIGNAKLSRRYVQLRNFFYLDLLLQQIANGARLSEAQVRCLRPEEIEMCLSRKSWVPPGNLSDRTKYSVLTLTESSEDLFSGFDFKWVESKLDNAIRTPHTRNQKLTGNPLCPGVAKGRVRIINRREQALSSGFQKGDIIVSHSADPELSDLMAEAGGVLVETGGVTCHAAIICRELGKPAISNISNLRAELSDGDFVEMDSYIGEVQIKRMRPMRYAKHSRNITPEDRLQVGTKATTLAILESLGFSIPGFFVVPLKSDALSASPDDASGTEKNLFIQEIQDAVDLVGGKMFILRSSLVDEDIIGVSTAGQYVSESNVDHEDIMATLLRLIDRYSKALSENEGSIIVQEMILSDYSGVCFTSNPLTGSGDQMIIELVPGGNDLLTGGVIAPKTLHFSKSTRTLEDVTGSNSWGRFFDSQIILDLAECCRKIEEHFGRPQDIEWAVKGSRLWIVQSRDIQTSDSSVLPARKFDAHARGGLRDIATICRAYRVPPNLKLHLLRVAAFASKICQNWAGAKIDQQLIIKALLLHDIGNIVKADYRRNPGLFPEEMQNLKYWMAVQDMIKEKYGDDDMGATLAIAQDIGVSDNVIKLITEKQFILNDETLQSDDWNRKIAAYSDQRIGPWGVLSLRERLSEAKRRYKNVEGASVNIRGFEGLVRSAEKIEAQLTENLKFNILTIDDKMLEPIIEDLRSMRIF